MLCGECEDRFSAHESEFARRVFHPFAATGVLSAKYAAWLRQFAASVCWRILEERIATDGLNHFAGRWTAELAATRETWQDYLNDRRPDVGGHHLHLLPGPSSGRPGVCADVVCTDSEAFVFARLGPFGLFGLISDSASTEWRGTRINAEGKLKPRDVLIPARHRNCLDSRTA
jgi:hypothetical protein